MNETTAQGARHMSETTTLGTVTAPDAEATADVVLPDAPPIAGLRFRRFRGPSDLPALADVNRASRLHDGVQEIMTVERLAVAFAHPTNWDPRMDVLLAEVDGRVVAYTRTEWNDDTSGGRTYESLCVVHPEVRRQGLGRALVHHNERRLLEVAASHPADRQRWLDAYHAGADQGARVLLLSEGYEPIREFHEMIRPTLDDVPDVPMPAGFDVRPARPDQLRRLFEADAEAFRDHWGEQDESEEAYLRLVNDPDLDLSLWQVAWDGDEVAAIVMTAVNTKENELLGVRRGWLRSVAVRRPWRRRGLARALMVRSLRQLRELGMTSAALGVDTENPHQALHLYETLGFRTAWTWKAYRKPLPDTASGN